MIKSNLLKYGKYAAFVSGRCIKHPKKIIKSSKFIAKQSNQDIKWSRSWKKLLQKICLYIDVQDEFVEALFDEEIFPEKVGSVGDGVILLCVVKDDLERVQSMIPYYKKLGVQNFVFLDDGSSDGTKDFLISQNDVDVWRGKSAYTTNMRQVWLTRLVEHYGYNKWYIIVDSDEFLTYKNCETLPIAKVVSYMEENGYTQAHCFMLDMYGRNGLYSQSGESHFDFMLENIYFDTNTYEIIKGLRLDFVSGGMRSRCFNIKPIRLSKYPLFYAKKGYVPINSHFPFPIPDKKTTLNLGVLRHYKFLPSDKKRYQKRVQQGNFYNNSEEYVLYTEKEQSILDAAYDNNISGIYNDSFSLNEIILPDNWRLCSFD